MSYRGLTNFEIAQNGTTMVRCGKILNVISEYYAFNVTTPNVTSTNSTTKVIIIHSARIPIDLAAPKLLRIMTALM